MLAMCEEVSAEISSLEFGLMYLLIVRLADPLGFDRLYGADELEEEHASLHIVRSTIYLFFFVFFCWAGGG